MIPNYKNNPEAYQRAILMAMDGDGATHAEITTSLKSYISMKRYNSSLASSFLEEDIRKKRQALC